VAARKAEAFEDRDVVHAFQHRHDQDVQHAKRRDDQKRGGDDVGDDGLNLENLEKVRVRLLPALGLVTGQRLDLLRVRLGLGVVVGAADDFVDDVLLVQQRLGVVEHHVSAAVVGGRDAGGEDPDDFGGRQSTGRAGEGDDVVHLRPQHVREAAPDDDAVGGGFEAGEIAFAHFASDGCDGGGLLG